MMMKCTSYRFVIFLFCRIFGYHGPGFTEWLVIDLDFTTVVSNDCVDEDYYPWVPTDEVRGRGEGALMMQKDYIGLF